MAYNEFAYFYDELNSEADYDALYRYVTDELAAHGIRDGILADLGCGTGDLTLMLAQAGYDVIGIDRSEEMLSVLREKADELDMTGRILLLRQDLLSLDLYGTIRAAVSSRIEHIKQPLFGFVGYARAVVSNFDADHAVFLFCRQADIRTFRRILDGVVHDIDNDLYDQAGVHIGHQHIVLKFYANLVFRSPVIHMGKRFMENVANHLCVPPQRQGPVFDSGDGKQILRQIDQPHGIVIDGTVHFLFSIFIQ